MILGKLIVTQPVVKPLNVFFIYFKAVDISVNYISTIAINKLGQKYK